MTVPSRVWSSHCNDLVLAHQRIELLLVRKYYFITTRSTCSNSLQLQTMDAPIDFVAENIETMMSEDDDFICNEDVLASDNDVDDTPIDVVAAKNIDTMMSEDDDFVCNEEALPSDNDDNDLSLASKTPASCLTTNKQVHVGAALLLAGGCCGAAVLALQQSHPSPLPSFRSSPVSPSSSSPLGEEGNGDLLDLLDLNQRAACGRHKCFYRAEKDPTKGYLVATRTRVEELEKGWEYANCLEQTYGISHYMNAGPFTSDLSKDMASSLNEIAFSFSDEIEPPTFIKETVVVQEVRPADDPHMLIGCNKKKRHFLESGYFDEFVEHIPNKKKFLKTLDKNVRTMFDTIRSEPALMDDFQVIVHQDGSIHYLDFSTSNADWASGSPFNSKTYRNNLSSCAKMARPIYEKVGATTTQLEELDAYLDGIVSEANSHVGQRLRANYVKKKNACLHHLLGEPKDEDAESKMEIKTILSKS